MRQNSEWKAWFQSKEFPTCFIVWDGLKVYTTDEPRLVHTNDLDSHMPRKDTIKMSESLSNQAGNTRTCDRNDGYNTQN